MGFYAGYALSLYGRPRDRLSHVLVTPRYESHPDFYYPTPYSRVIYTPPPDSRPLDTQRAEVSLAEIPFVSLRHGLDDRLLAGEARFSEAVAAARRSLAPPRLIVEPRHHRLICGEAPVPLPPAEMAFYTWLARRRRGGSGPTHWSDDNAAEALLTEYAALVGAHSGPYERMERALAQGMTKDYFEQRKAKTNAAIQRALGRPAATPYLVQRIPARPYSRFGLHGVPPERIDIREVDGA